MTREEATKLVDEYRRSLMDFCSVNYVLPKVSPEKGDRLNDAAEAIIAALTTPAPQGEWVTVPRKATVQMAEAAERESVKHRTAGPAYFEFAYEAMLAAAPQPPQPEPHTDDVALVDALDVSEQTILELVCAVEREDNWYADGAFGKQKHVREHVRRAKEACDKARAAAAIRALADKETQSNG